MIYLVEAICGTEQRMYMSRGDSESAALDRVRQFEGSKWKLKMVGPMAPEQVKNFPEQANILLIPDLTKKIKPPTIN